MEPTILFSTEFVVILSKMILKYGNFIIIVFNLCILQICLNSIFISL